MEQVALAHDPSERALGVDNRQVADAPLPHDVVGNQELLVALEGDHVGRHEISNVSGSVRHGAHSAPGRRPEVRKDSRAIPAHWEAQMPLDGKICAFGEGWKNVCKYW